MFQACYVFFSLFILTTVDQVAPQFLAHFSRMETTSSSSAMASTAKPSASKSAATLFFAKKWENHGQKMLKPTPFSNMFPKPWPHGQCPRTSGQKAATAESGQRRGRRQGGLWLDWLFDAFVSCRLVNHLDLYNVARKSLLVQCRRRCRGTRKKSPEHPSRSRRKPALW